MQKDGRVHRNVSLNSLDPPLVRLNSSAVPTYAYFQLPYSRRSVSDLDFRLRCHAGISLFVFQFALPVKTCVNSPKATRNFTLPNLTSLSVLTQMFLLLFVLSSRSFIKLSNFCFILSSCLASLLSTSFLFVFQSVISLLNGRTTEL